MRSYKLSPSYKPSLFTSLAALTLLAAAPPPAARAQTAAIDFTSSGFSSASITSTRGYRFNVTSSVTVTGLSFFDELSDGLAQAHDVGIWDSAGTLLTSLNIPSGTAAPLDSSGKFRYLLLSSPITLPVAVGYKVGAVFVANSSDRQFTNQVGLTNAPGISYVGGAFTSNGINALTFPSSNISSGFGGGSFVLGAAAVPEPGTLALLALGGAVLLVGRRRSRSAT